MTGGKTGTKKPVPAFIVHAFPFALSPFAIKSNPSQQNNKYEIKDRKTSSRLPLEKKGVFCNNPRYAFGASPLV